MPYRAGRVGGLDGCFLAIDLKIHLVYQNIHTNIEKHPFYWMVFEAFKPSQPSISKKH